MDALSKVVNTPQSAADLMDLLERSQLFAESIFGQVREQSAPFLDRTAAEFANALVQKRVLTIWQAREFLKGRWAFYAGTFRLLERLAISESGALFIAEQAGPQRLVLLQVKRRFDDSLRWEECHRQLEPGRNNVPRQLRCIETQKTESCSLDACEFWEGSPLAWALTSAADQLPNSRQRADLLRQFAEAVDATPVRDLNKLSLDSTLINESGELRFLSERREPEAGIFPEGNQNSASEAMRVIDRFARAIGGVDAVTGCTTPGEVSHELSGQSEPWIPPVLLESPQFLRGAMSRYLRKGPALSRIQRLPIEHQFRLANPRNSDALILAPIQIDDKAPAASSTVTSDFSSEERSLSAGKDSELCDHEACALPLTGRSKQDRKRRHGIAWVMLVAGSLTAASAVNWYWPEMIKKAQATVEELFNQPEQPARQDSF